MLMVKVPMVVILVLVGVLRVKIMELWWLLWWW